MNRLIETAAAAGSAAGCCCGRHRPRRRAGGESSPAHQTFWAGGAEYVTGSGRGAAGPPFRLSSGPALRRGVHATEERLDGAGGRSAQGRVRAAAGAAGPGAEGQGVGSHRDALLRLVHVQCDCTADVCICGALPPKRIHEDGTKCLKDHFVKVHKVHGTVVDGLGNRNGERRLKAVWSVKSKNHGGARPTRKQRLEEIETNGFGQVWVHRHARAEWHKCAGIEEEEVSMEGSDSCNYCLHPDVCLCAFSKVTPGCCNK